MCKWAGGKKLMKGSKNYGTDATLSQSTGREQRNNQRGEKYVTGVMQCAERKG